MSFRYTNNLIGVMKHRVLLERSRRSIINRQFVGACNGVVVTCTAYGTVTAIDVTPEAQASSQYTLPDGSVNTALLSTSIRGAVFVANRQLRHAKEEAHRQSIVGIEELKARHGSFRMWFEQDGGSMRPLPFESIANETGATDWSRSVRHDLSDSPLTIADVHRGFQPGLICLEDSRTLRSEQRKEMAEDERAFWQRVELIRKGQAAAIQGPKRRYKDDGQQGTTLQDASEEKVVLKFVQ